MDDCKQVFALLSEYLDADLPPETCAEIETHIAACPPCVKFLESLRRTRDLCRGQQKAGQTPRISAVCREELLAAYRKMLAERRA
jgi:RNA polymerase sigma-70 factor, ECF subfamily